MFSRKAHDPIAPTKTASDLAGLADEVERILGLCCRRSYCGFVRKSDETYSGIALQDVRGAVRRDIGTRRLALRTNPRDQLV